MIVHSEARGAQACSAFHPVPARGIRAPRGGPGPSFEAGAHPRTGGPPSDGRRRCPGQGPPVRTPTRRRVYVPALHPARPRPAAASVAAPAPSPCDGATRTMRDAKREGDRMWFVRLLRAERRTPPHRHAGSGVSPNAAVRAIYMLPATRSVAAAQSLFLTRLTERSCCPLVNSVTKPTACLEIEMPPPKRPPIPAATQTNLLLTNRHACCVCQKHMVQIHHIDSNPTNNQLSNLACLCVDHHDMATSLASLTKKLTPQQVRIYKETWEGECKKSVYALSRARFSFFYSMYKNPARVREAIASLPTAQLTAAVDRVKHAILEIPAERRQHCLGGSRHNPGDDRATTLSLSDIKAGRSTLTFLPSVRGHAEDASLPNDLSTEAGLTAHYAFDTFVQAQIQVLAEARGTIPLEDLYSVKKEEDFDGLAGRLVTFTGGLG